MNVMNIFWAFLSCIIGLVLSSGIVFWGIPMVDGLFGASGLMANSLWYGIFYLGLLSMVMILTIVFPVAVALDDDGKIARAIGVKD